MDFRQSAGGYTVRLDRGEEIVSTLTGFLAEQGVRAGALTAIGAVDEAELGLFSMERKEYLRRDFSGEYEIVALTGNVSTLDGEPFAHLHVLLSDQDFAVIGGHLFRARVSVTCEIDLVVQEGEITRRPDALTALKLMDFSGSAQR